MTLLEALLDGKTIDENLKLAQKRIKQIGMFKQHSIEKFDNYGTLYPNSTHSYQWLKKSQP